MSERGTSLRSHSPFALDADISNHSPFLAAYPRHTHSTAGVSVWSRKVVRWTNGNPGSHRPPTARHVAILTIYACLRANGHALSFFRLGVPMVTRGRWLLFLLLASTPAALMGQPDGKLPPLWHPLDVEGMDLAYKPWDDFYEFANGKWLRKLHLPADKPRLYVFTLLQEDNLAKLRRIAENGGERRRSEGRGSRQGRRPFIAAAWTRRRSPRLASSRCMAEFDRLAGLKKRDELLPALARLHLLRVSAGFNFGSSPDGKDSRRTIADFMQGGLGLPDRDYYLKDDDKTKAIRAAYLSTSRRCSPCWATSRGRRRQTAPGRFSTSRRSWRRRPGPASSCATRTAITTC